MSIDHLTHTRGEKGKLAPMRALPEGYEWHDSSYWKQRCYQVAQDLLKNWLYKEDYLKLLETAWPGEMFDNLSHKKICLGLDKVRMTLWQEHPERVMLELTPEELYRLAKMAIEASE